jgi:hypothetical protein
MNQTYQLITHYYRSNIASINRTKFGPILSMKSHLIIIQRLNFKLFFKDSNFNYPKCEIQHQIQSWAQILSMFDSKTPLAFDSTLYSLL